MRFQPTILAALAVVPLASAQLHALAVKAGLKYFGTATDVGELNNTEYVKILRDKKEWGQLVGSNGQKVTSTISLCEIESDNVNSGSQPSPKKTNSISPWAK